MSSNYKKITTNDSVINIINHPALRDLANIFFHGMIEFMIAI